MRRNQWITGVFALFLALLIVLHPMTAAASETDGGTCGEGVSWRFYEDGLLEINGSGSMTDYTNSSTPWKAYRNQITRIDSWCFYGCQYAASVTLPAGLVCIGDNAFVNCSAMGSLRHGGKRFLRRMMEAVSADNPRKKSCANKCHTV